MCHALQHLVRARDAYITSNGPIKKVGFLSPRRVGVRNRGIPIYDYFSCALNKLSDLLWRDGRAEPAQPGTLFDL